MDMEHDLDLPEITYPLTIDTIGKMIATGHTLTGYCKDYQCRHRATIDLVAFARRYGVDHPCDYWSLQPRFRCSVCGHKGVTLSMGIPDRTRARQNTGEPQGRP